MTQDRVRATAFFARVKQGRRAFATAAILAMLEACSSSSYPLMPTPDVYVGPNARPLFTKVTHEEGHPAIDLFYLTNRAPAAEPPEDAPYGPERSRFMSFGSATVEVGENVGWDVLTSQSIAVDRRVSLDLHLGDVHELGRFPQLPYGQVRTALGRTRSPAVLEVHERAAAALQAEVARRLAASPRKEVVLFVHGYHNQFRSAAFTISELCHFLGREFVCAMFSWPAGGTRGFFLGYNVDRESAEYSTLHLKQAIRLIAQTPGLERLHLVAHSRGTDLLVSALEQLAIESYVMGEQWSKRLKIENVVLAAPDIDSNVAVEKIFSLMSDPDLPMGKKPSPRHVFEPGTFRITIYTSPDDRALSLSQLLFGSLRRLGQLDQVELTQEDIERAAPLEGMIDVIKVTGRTDFFGHSYFTSNPEVSADLIRLLRYQLLPNQPGRPLQHVTGPFWRLSPPRQ